MSAHHNLFAHCVSRNPRFNGARLGASEELVDYRNNVIYNWGSNNVYGGEAGNYNIVNNYYRYGPSTSKSVRSRIVNPTRQEKPFINFGKFYVNGNEVDGDDAVSKDNNLGVHLGTGATEEDKRASIATGPFTVEVIPVQSARKAYELILEKVGASLPKRDTLDQRIISNVKDRTGGIIDVQGGYPHGTEYDQTITAWPSLRSIPPPMDTDKDGMPDDWEKKNGLNPSDPADASTYKLSKSFTNIEVYINDITKN
jgi:hypothetical protein